MTIEHNTLGGGGIGQILRQRTIDTSTYAATDRWFHYDQVGSVVLETDSSGASAQSHDQDAFGNTLASWITGLIGGDRPGRHHNTKEFDEDIGLVYMYQRWYSPELGIFISSAPYPPMMEHRYSFAGQNPVSSVDPDGRLAWNCMYGPRGKYNPVSPSTSTLSQQLLLWMAGTPGTRSWAAGIQGDANFIASSIGLNVELVGEMTTGPYGMPTSFSFDRQRSGLFLVSGLRTPSNAFGLDASVNFATSTTGGNVWDGAFDYGNATFPQLRPVTVGGFKGGGWYGFNMGVAGSVPKGVPAEGGRQWYVQLY